MATKVQGLYISLRRWRRRRSRADCGAETNGGARWAGRELDLPTATTSQPRPSFDRPLLRSNPLPLVSSPPYLCAVMASSSQKATTYKYCGQWCVHG